MFDSVDKSTLTAYTLEEVAKHTEAGDLWMVLHGFVLDVSNFPEEHPDGPEAIFENSGKDATDEFDDVGHSDEAEELAMDMLIGYVVDASEAAAEKEEEKKEEKVEAADALVVNTAGHEGKLVLDEVSAEKTAFCRCWKSQKFPYCDGSHRAFNEATGSNVGPVIVCCQAPAAATSVVEKVEAAESVNAAAKAEEVPRKIPVSAAAQKQDKILQDTKARVKREQRSLWPLYVATGIVAVSVAVLVFRKRNSE